MVDFAVDGDDALRQRIQANTMISSSTSTVAIRRKRCGLRRFASPAVVCRNVFYRSAGRSCKPAPSSRLMSSSAAPRQSTVTTPIPCRYFSQCQLGSRRPPSRFRSDRHRQATRCICPAARGLSKAVRRSCDQRTQPSGKLAQRGEHQTAHLSIRALESLAWSRYAAAPIRSSVA